MLHMMLVHPSSHSITRFVECCGPADIRQESGIQYLEVPPHASLGETATLKRLVSQLNCGGTIYIDGFAAARVFRRANRHVSHRWRSSLEQCGMVPRVVPGVVPRAVGHVVRRAIIKKCYEHRHDTLPTVASPHILNQKGIESRQT